MSRLDLIRAHGEGDASRVHVIVVPGVAGASLDQRTCPHFREWLDRIVLGCKSRVQSWVYIHHIEIDTLKSWDEYSRAGDELLLHLLSMQEEQRFRDDDTLILIGHKLGCYLLKQALTEAWNKDHRGAQKKFLEMIEAIIMVGEPDLRPDNQENWLSAIAQCISTHRPLPKRLAKDLSVGCLQCISETFERALLLCTAVKVSGGPMLKQKHRFKFKRTEHHDGCVCQAAIHVQAWTTADEDFELEKGQGDDTNCSFHPQSPHYRNMLLLNDMPSLAEIRHRSAQSGSNLDELPQNLSIRTHTIMSGSESVAGGHLSEIPTNISSADCNVQDVGDHDDRSNEKHPPDCTETAITSLLESCTSTMMESTNTQTKTSCQTPAGSNYQIPSNTTRQRKRNPMFSNSMPHRDSLFCGRNDILSILHQALPGADLDYESEKIERTEPSISWLTGAPGIGKSAIALEHAYRSMDNVDHVFWLNASSPASLGSSCHDIAIALGLVESRNNLDHEASRGKFLDWLKDSSLDFLLVFDNLHSIHDLLPYLPHHGFGSIVVTSRETVPQEALNNLIEVVEVPGFNLTEATNLLRLTIYQGKRDETVLADVFAAGHYPASPIILRHLANYVVRRNIPVQTIKDLLDSTSLSLSLSQGQLLDVINMKVREMDVSEASLLYALCFLDPNGVQDNILLVAHHLRDLPLHYLPQTSQDLLTAEHRLWTKATIELDRQRKQIYVHKAVQDVVKLTMDSETWNDSFDTACHLVHKRWPSERKLRNIVYGFWPEFDSLHSHVWSLARSLYETSYRLRDKNGVFKKLLITSTRYNAHRGNMAEDRELVHLVHRLSYDHPPPKDYRVCNVPLPRRVIRIPLKPGSTAAPYLIETEGQRGPYVALSHSWGSSTTESLSGLTGVTMDIYKRGINPLLLPTYVLDAMTIARRLGIQYLWTDSLCIRQDSAEDWYEETTRMLNIYANATFTIAAGHTRGSQKLFSDPDIIEPCGPSYSIYKNPGTFLAWDIFACAPSLSLEGQNPSPKYWPSRSEIYDLHLETERYAATKTSSCQQTTPFERGQNDSEDATTVSTSNSESQRSCIKKSQAMLDRGCELLLENSFVPASSKLLLSRDLLGPLRPGQQDELELYGLASSFLGTTYHLLGLDSEALGILELSHDLYLNYSRGKQKRDKVLGRILLSMGTCLFSMGQLKESQAKFEAAREKLSETSGDQNEWSACIDIKLADCQVFANNFKEAHTLLNASMSYFQDRASESSQAHLPRILHRQSLVYKAQGNTIMHSAFTAAARDSLIRVTTTTTTNNNNNSASSSDTITTPVADATNRDMALLVQQEEEEDFDGLVEAWYR